MSGILGVIAAAGGGVNSAFSLALQDTSSSTPGVRTVSVTFGIDGAASAVGAGSAPNWYLPTSTGVGSGWSVRLTNSGSSNTTFSGASMGSWQVLSSAKSYSFSNSLSGNEGTGDAAVAFSPDGGTTVIAAGNINWDVGFIV